MLFHASSQSLSASDHYRFTLCSCAALALCRGAAPAATSQDCTHSSLTVQSHAEYRSKPSLRWPAPLNCHRHGGEFQGRSDGPALVSIQEGASVRGGGRHRHQCRHLLIHSQRPPLGAPPQRPPASPTSLSGIMIHYGGSKARASPASPRLHVASSAVNNSRVPGAPCASSRARQPASEVLRQTHVVTICCATWRLLGLELSLYAVICRH